MELWKYILKDLVASGLGFFDIFSIVLGSFMPILYLKPKTKGEALLMILSGIVVSTTLGIFITKKYELESSGGGTAIIYLIIALGGMFIIKAAFIFFNRLATVKFVAMIMDLIVNLYLKTKSNEPNNETTMDNNDEVDESTL